MDDTGRFWTIEKQSSSNDFKHFGRLDDFPSRARMRVIRITTRNSAYRTNKIKHQ
ncbi:MAG: hypothetical protein RBR35_14575 [Salinivirgaceae bacterium]|nr:hypothetical protein [Salinivirgaceae bacterium]